MNIKTAIADYLVEIEIKKYTPKTIRTYRIKLNIFERFCESEGIEDADEITMGVIKRFTQVMMKKGSKGTYINGLLKTIKSFCQFCFEEGYGAFNTKRVTFKWVKEEKPVIRAFSPTDVKMMLDNCRSGDYLGIRDAAILTMLFETGIRCYELCTIKPSDIHDDFIVIQGKNHKQRVVPITPILKKALMRYERVKESYFAFKPIDSYHFLSYRGKQLTNSAMEHLLKKRGELVKNVRVSPHTCRHFWAQQQVKMGTDLYTISRLLGHENIQITQTYLNSLKDEDVIKIAKQNSVLMNM